jgi:hypothetical protein
MTPPDFDRLGDGPLAPVLEGLEALGQVDPMISTFG